MECVQAATFVVHHKAFDKFVESIFKLKYDFLLATHHPKDSIIEYRAVGIPKDAPQPIRDKAAMLMSGQRVNDPQVILDTLVTHRAIPPGTYHISTKAPPAISGKWRTGKLKIVGYMA